MLSQLIQSVDTQLKTQQLPDSQHLRLSLMDKVPEMNTRKKLMHLAYQKYYRNEVVREREKKRDDFEDPKTDTNTNNNINYIAIGYCD